jgi:hypothetical protein
VAHGDTFSDGEFVLFGVRPGALTVRVDAAWLLAHQLTAASRGISLASTDDGATARVPAITLTPLR